jgi:hypothetical protein
VLDEGRIARVDRRDVDWRESLVLLAAFILIFFCARLPLFWLGWDGQDGSGHDADIFFHQPANPNYLLVGRIGGQETYVPPLGHPGPIYEMYALLGQAVERVIPLQTFSDLQIIVVLKVIASLFQLVVWIPLLWVMIRNCANRTSRLVGCLIITALALCPLAIQGNNEFQIDSTFGFVMAGAYALALLFADRNERHPVLGFLAIIAASAFLSLGKNEWTLVLIIAWGGLLVIWLTTSLVRRRADKQPTRRFLLCLSATFLGLGAGNLASYLFEPVLYMSGWELMVATVEQASIVSGAGRADFVAVNKTRIPFTQAPLFLIVFIASQAVSRRLRLSPGLILASVFGFGLFSAFFISTWGAFPRYFAPALAALSVAAVWFYVERPLKAVALWTCTLASCWLIVAGVRFAQSDDLARSSTFGIRGIRFVPDAKCVLVLPVEDAYRRKDLDFAHTGLDYEGAEEYAQQFGRHACPPS